MKSPKSTKEKKKALFKLNKEKFNTKGDDQLDQ